MRSGRSVAYRVEDTQVGWEGSRGLLVRPLSFTVLHMLTVDQLCGDTTSATRAAR